MKTKEIIKKLKEYKYVYHAFGDNSYPLCNQHFVHDTGIAENEESVTCKRCKKIIKKEDDFTRKAKK